MKRSEYIEALGAALCGAEASVRDDIIREMEGHIDELAERRPELDEEALIATLSPPESLAAGLLEELGLSETQSPSGSSQAGASASASSGPGASAAGGREAGSPFGERHGDGRDRRDRGPKSSFRVFDEAGKHGFTINIDDSDFEGLDELNDLGEKLKESFKGLDGLGATIRDAVRNAVRGFGGGLDSSSRDWSTELDVEGIDELSLDFSRADMSIEPCEGSTLGLEIEVEGEPDVLGDYEPLVTREGRALAIKDAEGSHARRLEIHVPASILRLAIDTVSGDIECDADGRDLRISSVSGDVELEHADRAQVVTTSGDLTMSDCAALVLETKSGDIEIEDVPGMIRAQSASGDISMEGVGGPVEVKSLSGDLELELGDGPVKASTASGNISLRAGAGFSGGEVDTKSGDVEADLGNASLEIYAETVSGDVELDGETAPDRIPHRLKAVAGQGGARLILRSVSGNVEAEWD